MKRLVSCTLEQFKQFMRLCDLYGWDKTWAALRGYLKTEPLRKKWIENNDILFQQDIDKNYLCKAGNCDCQDTIK